MPVGATLAADSAFDFHHALLEIAFENHKTLP